MKRVLLIFLIILLTGMGMMGAGAASKQDVFYWLDDEECVLTAEAAGNGTTGYQWICEQGGGGILAEISAEYIPDAAAGGVAGAGGKTVFVFEATGNAGHGTLTFDYKRAWEEDIESRFVIHLFANEAGLLSVTDSYHTIPFEWAEGDAIACPQCGNMQAVVAEIVSGGDEEGGTAWFLTIQCPDCGIVETMK